MKILNINKFYYLRRGAEKYYFDLTSLLEKNGHKVVPFAMEDKRNFKTPYSKYFVSNLELADEGKGGFGLKNFGRIMYSLEAKNKIKSLLNNEKIDLAHIHLIYHHISPSILGEIKKKGIPIVMTVHDYKLICPNYILYTKGSPCNRCKGHKYYNAVKNKCLKDSYKVSFAAMCEMYFHKAFKFYEKNVDVFIAPSQFVKNKLVEFGIDNDKIKVVPHFVELDKKCESNKSEKEISLIYAGAFSKEKGIHKFLEYFYETDLPIKIKIAGTGPLEKQLKDELKIKKDSRVEFLGYLEKKELEKSIKDSSAVLAPSVVYETFGLAVLDAYKNCKPVIASRIGALPELVQEKKTGFLFNIDSKESVINSVKNLIKNKNMLSSMGANGYKIAKEKYSPKRHYDAIIDIYNQVSP